MHSSNFSTRTLGVLAAACLALTASAQNPGTVLAAKRVRYAQTTASASALQNYSFEGFVNFPSPVTAAVTVTPPGRPTLPLTPGSPPDHYVLETAYSTATALEADFPNGTYTFAVSGLPASFTAPITTAAFPGATLFTNWTNLQSAPQNSIPVTWNPFPDGSVNDIVFVEVSHPTGYEYSSPNPGEPGALNGTSTSFTIPSLPAPGTYTLSLKRFVLEMGSGPTGTLVAGGRVFILETSLVVGGAPDTTPPTLVSVLPANGATGVPSTTTLTLRFSEPMNKTKSSLSLNGSPLSPQQTFWNEAGTETVIVLPSALPNGTYTLVVNPSSIPSEHAYCDLAGNPLATNTMATTFIVGSGPASSGTRLVNISTFGFVSTGGDVMIAGFVVQGSTPRTFLIRGVGPGLAGFGLPGAPVLADPKLALFQGATLIAENDNWSSSPNAGDIAAAFTTTGAFPLANPSLDAALLLTLPPGTYTAQLFGLGHTPTGKGLIEVYELP